MTGLFFKKRWLAFLLVLRGSARRERRSAPEQGIRGATFGTFLMLTSTAIFGRPPPPALPLGSLLERRKYSLT